MATGIPDTSAAPPQKPLPGTLPSMPEAAPEDSVAPEASERPCLPSVEMVEAVASTIDRMYSEFAHSVPRGVAIESMLSDWAAALARNGVPAAAVPGVYDAACDSRTRKGISSFMPTAHDLVAEWLKMTEERQREQAIEAGMQQRREYAEQWHGRLISEPIPAFEAQLEKGRALRNQAMRRQALGSQALRCKQKAAR